MSVYFYATQRLTKGLCVWSLTVLDVVRSRHIISLLSSLACSIEISLTVTTFLFRML